MSRFALCSIFVVLCAIQFVCAREEWEDQTHLQEGQVPDEEIPFVVQGRHERSAKNRKSDAKTVRHLKKNTRASSSPCKCSGATCTCCAKFTVDGKTEEGCSSFKVPDGRTRNQMVRYNFNFSDNSAQAQAQAPAGRDPQGMCQPFPRYPGSQVCSRYHSTKVEDGKVRFCLIMEAKYHGYTFYQMDFDCVTYDVPNQTQVPNSNA